MEKKGGEEAQTAAGLTTHAGEIERLQSTLSNSPAKQGGPQIEGRDVYSVHICKHDERGEIKNKKELGLGLGLN